MTSWNASPLRSLCRFRHPANEQKDHFEEASLSKRIKNEGRSGDMYENKEGRCQVPGFRCQDMRAWPRSFSCVMNSKDVKYEGRSGDMYENKEGRCQVPGFRCQDVRAWPRSFSSVMNSKDVKYEGRSGDMYENKEGRFRCQVSGVRTCGLGPGLSPP